MGKLEDILKIVRREKIQGVQFQWIGLSFNMTGKKNESGKRHEADDL